MLPATHLNMKLQKVLFHKEASSESFTGKISGTHVWVNQLSHKKIPLARGHIHHSYANAYEP